MRPDMMLQSSTETIEALFLCTLKYYDLKYVVSYILIVYV
jgi:hypothetical protein